MKKTLACILAAAMLFTTACGSKPTQPQAPANNEQNGEEAKNDSSVMPAIAKEDIKIGVIHITDPAEGAGYTYTHDIGIEEMKEKIGLEDSQIIRKNNVNDSDASAVETAILECIEEGANVIFATSWGYMDACEALAEEYPDVIFSHGTGYKSNGKNFNNYFGRIYQSRYLTGIAAGLKTETNKVGYVAAWGKDNSEVTGGLNAFAMGVYYANPEAEVLVKTTNSWFDPEGEKQAADALIAQGCDVIGQHCDTPNPQLAAEAAGVYGVGYNSDMSKDAPNAVLTSTIWHWGAYYTHAVQSVIDGTWTGEDYYGGMAEGLVNLAPLSELCAEGTAEKIAEEKAKIESGEWDVFMGVIETNTGETVGEEGKSLDDATITGGINWYFKNVVEK